ncbi:tRNA 2-thiouridine(34) synthase MnmA [Gaiella sp.]|jgi:tRNA-specific 2-thiouridylase|uniref:tRNA 2-thiouridine(34) synthase MnmA n=1 Tax=Gaiella sp. TaxID=2663207 RepID=UPI002E30180D|nr:tRNA 2-thiouridine(34) synthase MnmA [Gaiella sp.]HEX5582170.1 tRNA 2-thiouridine(34) synthase MnmA [Gaiella sp.]
MAVEIFGDSARGEEYAHARLVVEGEHVVEADTPPGMAEPLAGLTLLEAAAVPGETLAADAVANALASVFTAAPRQGRVAVAMSGGVDSAVALLRAGADAVGVTLRLWLDPAGPSAERACCSPDAVVRARETCHSLGLPHVTLDMREAFRDSVVRSFVDGYAHGVTPNPCMRCNGAFRFAALVDFSRRAGADILWTGHYARVVERGGRRLVAQARDAAKDQSYMLATVEPDLLRRVGFPLGGATKDEVRAEAADAGLAVAGRAESQEACFLAGGDYRSFLERHGVRSIPGTIVDESGSVLGAHDGLWRFTPGQRRGIGVAAPEPLYAVRADPATNTLVVGPRESLGVRHVAAAGRLHVPVTRAEAKLRYRSRPVLATVEPVEGGFELALDEPIEAVAPGQVAVLYDDGAVVGAGVVSRAGA